MFERYTEQARRAIFFARFEAVKQPARKISTAHLLIGLTRDKGSRADAVGSLLSQADELRSTLGIPRPPNSVRDLELEKEIGLDDSSKKVLAYAVEEAAKDDSYYIDTDHLLRGILRFPNEGTAALEKISVDLTSARIGSKRNRTESPEEKDFYHRVFGSPFRAHRDPLIKLLAVVIVVVLSALLIRWLNH